MTLLASRPSCYDLTQIRLKKPTVSFPANETSQRDIRISFEQRQILLQTRHMIAFIVEANEATTLQKARSFPGNQSK